MIVNNPTNHTYWNSPPPISITAIDPNFNSVWYRVNTVNVSLSNGVEELLIGSIWDSLGEGPFNIEIFANDTFGYVNNSLIITLYKDLTPPTIVVTSPSNNTYFNSAPNMFLTATDVSFDSIWYTVGGTKIMLTNGISQPLDSNIWNGLGQGEFQVYVFANDTAGNLNNTLMLTLLKDTLAPLVNVNLPYNNTYWNSRPTINIEGFDPNLNEVSYLVAGWRVIVENGNDTILLNLIWQDLDEGPFIMEIIVKDIFDHVNDSFKLTLYKDTVLPDIDIISPQPNDLFGENSPTVILNIQETNLDEVWYQLSNGTVVTNNYTWTGSIDQVVWDQVGNGTVTIRFYANDTATNINNQEVTVRKNIFAPIISIVSPQDNQVWGVDSPSFEIYKSGTSLDSTWYMLNSVNYTFSGTIGVINQLAWESFGYEMVTIMFYINDSLGKIGTDMVVVRKDPDLPIITIHSPINQTACASAPFINITIVEPNLDSCWYRYNNTVINMTGDLDQALDSLIWDSLPQGSFIIELFANDTVGNLNSLYKLHLSKDTIGPDIIIVIPDEDQKITREAPYFELSIVDVNNVDSSWYTIEGGEIILFSGSIGRIDQNVWANIWDNLDQGDVITIRFYANDTLGNENYKHVNVIKDETLDIIKFFTRPIGMIVPIIGIGVILPTTMKLTRSRYYKSLDKKEKGKLKKVLILSFFLCSLAILFYII